MLKPKILKFNNIGRFVEEQTIDFSHLSNLNQIDGKNNNTGGSSGSGKSTVFNSLDFLFGLNDIPNSILQSRLTKEPIIVTGIFDLDGKNLELTRSKKGLRIDLDGEVTEGSAKLAEEKLDQILGVPRDLFRKMLHKRQKEGGFFLDLTPKETHDFLTNSLGLSYLTDKVSSIDLDLKDIVKQKETIESNIASTSNILEGVKKTISSLVRPEIPKVTDESLEFFKTAAINADTEYRKIIEKHNTLKQELLSKRPSTDVIPYDNSTIDKLNDKKTKIESKLSEIMLNEFNRKSAINKDISDKSLLLKSLENEIREGDRSKQEIEKIVEEVKKIRSSLCPTCDQHWATESAKNKEMDLLNKIASFKTFVIKGTEASDKKNNIENEVLSLRSSLSSTPSEEVNKLEQGLLLLKNEIAEEKKKANSHVSDQNNKNQSLLNIFYEQQKRLEDSLFTEANIYATSVGMAQQIYGKAESELSNYKSNIARFNASLSNLQSNQQEYERQLVSDISKFKELENKLIVVEEVKRAIKTYTSYSFDDALASISDRATAIIRSIPNMSNSTITLEGSKETKEGKVKEEVTAVISNDGELEIPIKSLSGGERSSIDLAIDLAVIDMLESKTNVGVDVFILDEPFSGLDSQNIEMILEVLRGSNLNKKLIIVDHNQITKELVDKTITVVRTGTESRIEQ